MLLVVPGDDRRVLDELLGRGADGRAERLQGGNQLSGRPRRIPTGSRSGTSACSSELKASTFLRSAELQRGGRRLVEPELPVRLVARKHEPVATREAGRALELNLPGGVAPVGLFG